MSKTLKTLRNLAKIASEVMGNGCQFYVPNNTADNFWYVMSNGKIRGHVRKNSDMLSCLFAMTEAIIDEIRGAHMEFGGIIWSSYDEDMFVVALWVRQKPQYDIAWEVRLKGDKVTLKKTDWGIKPIDEDEEEISIRDYFARLVNAMLLIKEVSKSD
jgi:hypothetical protein